MKKKNYSEMTVEELQKQLKITKLVTGMLAGMLMVLVGLNIYLWTQQKSMPTMAVAFALSPILFLNWGVINKIKKEL
jgi:hypothetical protein